MSRTKSVGSQATPLRVVTYNVHRCFGTDGRRDAHRVARVLRQMEPDLVALQEVDTSLDRRTTLGQLRVLAHATGLEPVNGPTMERDGGYYGNAMLTRFPVREVRRVDLSVAGYEPRGALDVEVEFGGRSLRVVATHLGLNPAERRDQIGRLLSHLYRRPRGAAAMVLGDFNEWFRFSRGLRRLNSYLGYHQAEPSYPSRRPVLALDRIWVAPKTALVERKVHLSPLARVASDHLPVVATLRV